MSVMEKSIVAGEERHDAQMAKNDERISAEKDLVNARIENDTLLMNQRLESDKAISLSTLAALSNQTAVMTNQTAVMSDLGVRYLSVMERVADALFSKHG